MTTSPEYRSRLTLAWDSDGERPAAPLAERRSYSEPYDKQTFAMITRARREMTVTLAAQPVFDLTKSAPVARRIRRSVRHRGGEGALQGFGGRMLETSDLQRIDLQSLRHSLDLLRLGARDSGVAPVFWRTVDSIGDRFALLSAELQRSFAPGALLIEVTGGLDHAPLDAVEDVVTRFAAEAVGVILHISPDAGSARRLAHVGAQCMAIDFAGVEHEGAREWQGAAQLISVARAACPQVMLLNLRPDRGLAAQAAGATHAVFAGMNTIIV